MEEPEDSNNSDWNETNSLLPGSFLSTTIFEGKREDRSGSESHLLDDSILQNDHQHDPISNSTAVNQKSRSGLNDTKENNTRYMPLSSAYARTKSYFHIDTLQHHHCITVIMLFCIFE
jgi:hypothetical protein